MDTFQPKKLPQSVIRLLELIFEKDFQNDQATAYAHYKQLNTRIPVLPTSANKYKVICDYVRNTHGPTHKFKIKVEHIFTVSRQGEYRKYESTRTVGNCKLLWHGTKSSNYRSILSNGLSTKPPSDVPTNSKMFGNGIYFADVVTKSAQYCNATKSKPYGVLTLAEVALGKHYYRTDAIDVQELKYNKGSVEGLGKYKPDRNQTIRSKHGAQIPLGTLVHHDELDTVLDYSEYIVYNDDQVLFQYLVLVKFEF